MAAFLIYGGCVCGELLGGLAGAAVGQGFYGAVLGIAWGAIVSAVALRPRNHEE